MLNLDSIVHRVSQFTKDNSPAILTAVGVVGSLTAAYLTGTATVKAVKLVEQEEAARGYDFEAGEHLTPIERVGVAWKCYIPAVSTAALSVTAIIVANRVSSRRVASVATALAIGEKAFSDYKDKIVEKLGENKERGIRDSIAQDHVRLEPPRDEFILFTGGGHVLCRDEYSGRYFWSSMESIKKAENDLNFRILHDGDQSLSEFYALLGLPKTSHSDDLGWNSDDALEITYTSALTDKDIPCISFTFDTAPFPTFYKSR